MEKVLTFMMMCGIMELQGIFDHRKNIPKNTISYLILQ